MVGLKIRGPMRYLRYLRFFRAVHAPIRVTLGGTIFHTFPYKTGGEPIK